MNFSFDVIGNIALLKLPDSLKSLKGSKKKRKEKEIARQLMELHKNIETVAVIESKHKTKFRVQKLRIIAGRKSFLTIHREHGCLFKIRLNKSFFSPRLSFERNRIARKVKPVEKVAVFFAGAGPFSIVIAKHSKAKKVFSVELNPDAVKDMKENIKLNKLEGRVVPVLDDVKKYAKKHKREFDRIVMPLPAQTEHFLDTAFQAVKNNGAVHYYDFVERTPLEKDQFRQTIGLIRGTAKKHRAKIRVLEKRIVRSVSPAINHIVIDFKVSFQKKK